VTDGGPALSVRAVDGIAEIGAAAWDACAGADNPFTRYAFLHALEETKCVGGRTGWQPYHLAVESNGQVIGVMPMYAKSHSQGEYVFDYGWANALERAGGRYYPKLQVAVPFTPATGPRLLVRPGNETDNAYAALIHGAVEVAKRAGVSSLHVTFPTETDCQRFEAAGFLVRNDQQFHWENDGYATFDDFLAALASRKRKQIRKERAEAIEPGIEIEALNGSAITTAAWDAFYTFYMDTGGRKWGRPYLNRAFFHRLGETMADRVVLIMCRRRGKYIAGALNLMGHDTLYGRNWGCVENHRFLHFETCYYQAIEYAIRHGLKRVEAGAQGEHKLARGYRPVKTFSAHWIRDPNFRRAVENYLVEERSEVERGICILDSHNPFRKVSDEHYEESG
jgi:predicted N-acyltransferase